MMFVGESRRAYPCIISRGEARRSVAHFIYRFLARSARFFVPVVLHASHVRALPTFSAANICPALARGLYQGQFNIANADEEKLIVVEMRDDVDMRTGVAIAARGTEEPRGPHAARFGSWTDFRRGSAGNRILLRKKGGSKYPNGGQRGGGTEPRILPRIYKRARFRRGARKCAAIFSLFLSLSLSLSLSLFPRTSEYDFPDFFASSFFPLFLQMLRPIVYPGNPHFPARERANNRRRQMTRSRPERDGESFFRRAASSERLAPTLFNRL